MPWFRSPHQTTLKIHLNKSNKHPVEDFWCTLVTHNAVSIAAQGKNYQHHNLPSFPSKFRISHCLPLLHSPHWSSSIILNHHQSPAREVLSNTLPVRSTGVRINWIMGGKFGQWAVQTGRVSRPGAPLQVITQSLRAAARSRKHRLPIDLLSSQVSTPPYDYVPY